MFIKPLQVIIFTLFSCLHSFTLDVTSVHRGKMCLEAFLGICQDGCGIFMRCSLLNVPKTHVVLMKKDTKQQQHTVTKAKWYTSAEIRALPACYKLKPLITCFHFDPPAPYCLTLDKWHSLHFLSCQVCSSNPTNCIKQVSTQTVCV